MKSFKDVLEEVEQQKISDAERLRTGQATPEQIQEENRFFPRGPFKILPQSKRDAERAWKTVCAWKPLKP